MVLVASCNVNKDFMFKTPIDFSFDTLRMETVGKDFTLSPNDRLNITVFTNDGSVVFEATTSRDRLNINEPNFTFLVRSNGFVELPIVGDVYAQGKTIVEFQQYLEDLFEKQFVDPMVRVDVLNRRAIVFNGNGSRGAVISLNNNLRLIEVLGLSGGLGNRANASKIKVIRNVDGENQVFLVDLSTIDGIDQANMIIENGDIVYVESTKDIGRELATEVTPYVSLFTAIILFSSILLN